MFEHRTVLFNEAIAALDITPQGVYVDCTLGGGGHARAILDALDVEGRLICLDQDVLAIGHAEKTIGNDKRCIIRHTNFSQLTETLHELDYKEVNGILFDLGVSSPQLDTDDRGFSYHSDAKLDMRMDQTQSLTAHTLVNETSEEKLADIIYHYGEERWAKRIAKFIVDARKQGPINTTAELVQVIKKAIPAKARQDGHPGRKTFQALRIAVNDELNNLSSALEQAVDILAVNGRLVCISFHSLEDRIIKNLFKNHTRKCICPPDLPVCVCNQQPKLALPGRQPILPSKDEIERNRRARSARLRVAIRVDSSKK